MIVDLDARGDLLRASERRTVRAVLARLRRDHPEFEWPERAVLHSIRTGEANRSTGAFSWMLYDLDGRDLGIGSQWAANELLREREKWHVCREDFAANDISISPAAWA